ncbi:MAG: hypothetical protein HY001_02195 [Candidatus Portnoybacteria bacterium]|nr:hypothetical protein [Candidatus Portnoybacteria bacterium]
MEKHQRAQQADQGRFLIKEGLEDKRQLEEMKEQGNIEKYINGFFYDMENSSGSKALELVQDLVDFMKHEPYGDRELEYIIPKLYGDYFLEEYVENDGYFSRSAVEHSLNNFMELYAMTGIPPRVRDGKAFLSAAPLLLFSRLIEEPDYGERINDLLERINRQAFDEFDETALLRETFNTVKRQDGEKKLKEYIHTLYREESERHLNSEYWREWELEAMDRLHAASEVEAQDDIKEKLKARSAELVANMMQNFTPEHLPYFYRGDYIFGEEKELGMIEHLTGIKADFTPHQPTLLNAYNLYFSEYVKKGNDYGWRDYDGHTLKETIDYISNLTGIEPVFDHAVIADFYESLRRSFIELSSSYASVQHIPFLEPINIARELTGIEPAYTQEQIQNLYDVLLTIPTDYSYHRYGARIESWFHKLEEELAAFEKVTGVPRSFSEEKRSQYYKESLLHVDNMQEALGTLESCLGTPLPTLNPEDVEKIYDGILNRVDINRSEHDSQIFSTFTETKPSFNSQAVQGKYKYLLTNSSPSRIKQQFEALARLTGIEADFSQMNQEVQDLYAYYLERELLSLYNLRERIQTLRALTGIDPAFSQEKIHSAYKKVAAGNVMYLEETFAYLQEVSGQALPKEAIDIFAAQAFESHDRRRYWARAVEFYTKIGIEDPGVNPQVIGPLLEKMKQTAFINPQRIPGHKETLLSLVDQKEKRDAFLSQYEGDPWLATFDKLLKIQDISDNQEHDPWINELRPLLQKVSEQKILSLDRPEDAELLYQFISEVGMVNLPQLFAVYADCKRAKGFEDLSSETRTTLERFGIPLQRADGSWRLQNPLQLIAELNKRRDQFQKELLGDAIPAGLETSLGEEIFARLKGTTRWERGTSLASMLSAWRATQEKKPELAKLPPYFTEKQFDVPFLAKNAERSQATEQEIADKVKQFLASQEVADTYRPLAQSLSRALRLERPASWWQQAQRDVLQVFDEDIQEMNDLLAANLEELDELVAKEANEKQRSLLERKVKALKNPKARGGFESQHKALQATREHFASLTLTQEQASQEAGIVSLMESLRELGNKVPDAGMLLRQLSAFHVMAIAEQGWKEQLQEQLYQEYVPSANLN